MTSNNDQDIDLGLPMGPTNDAVEVTGLGDNRGGAGVNAIYQTEMVTLEEPLCELVWSAHSGVSLNKCADSSCFDQRPSLLWNVWPEINQPQASKSGVARVADEEKLIVSPDVVDVISECREKGALSRSSRSSSSCQLKENGKEKDLCGSHRVRVSGSSGKHAADMRPRQESEDEVTSTRGEVNKKKIVTPVPIPGPVLNSGAESSHTDSVVRLRREKGKRKALSCEGSSNEGDENQDSTESCHSTRLSSRGIKRRRNDETRSERRKIHIQESRVFSMAICPSFVNWISTIVKGRRSDNVTQVGKCDTESRKSGFLTMFQSLYNPIAKKSESKETIILSSRMFEKGNQGITQFYPKANPDKTSEGHDDSGKETQRFPVPSVFAKILDALKQVMRQLENTESSTCKIICYFCGKGGHDLRKCPRLTETELRGLLVKIGSFEGVGEDPPRLCLKCFQFGHWAVSCSSGTADVACGSKKLLTSNELREYDSEGERNDLNLFRAVSKLRLSRADILRWRKFDVSLDGFFLRLRLRTSESGLEGTGYYVARITEDAVENISCDSKKSILVDVGGIKSCVGSEYISNHDFLQEEIKAWLGGIEKAGGKIPSLEELNAKVKDRTCLGFGKKP